MSSRSCSYEQNPAPADDRNSLQYVLINMYKKPPFLQNGGDPDVAVRSVCRFQYISLFA